METTNIDYKGYKFYWEDGRLVGYKAINDGLDRLVTNCKSIPELREYLKPKRRPESKPYDPYQDENQIRIEL